jgi:choline dehydrogenase
VRPAKGVTIAPTVVDVASRGRLRLRSTDPRWKPAIDAGYYTDESDMDAMLAGVKVVQEIAARSPLSRYIDRPFLPGPDVTGDDALREVTRAATETLYHPVGTCAMGTGEEAVVDPELRVRGIDGLRVVDASVMPAVPRGNTNAPTIALAERAADLLLGRRPLAPNAPQPAFAARPDTAATARPAAGISQTAPSAPTGGS